MEGHPGASAKRPNHKRVWSQGWGEACLRERVGWTDDEAAGSGRVLTTLTQEVLSHGCLNDSTKQGPAGLNTSKPGQCPEPVLCGPHGLFQKPHSATSRPTLSLCLHPPFTNAFPDLCPSTEIHNQPGCVLGFPPASPRGAPVGPGHSLASVAAPHLDLYAGNGRLLIVMEEWL